MRLTILLALMLLAAVPPVVCEVAGAYRISIDRNATSGSTNAYERCSDS